MPDTFYGWTEADVLAVTDPFKVTSRDVVYAKEAFALTHRAVGYNSESVKAYNAQFLQYSTARENRPDLPEPFGPPVPPFAQIVVVGSETWPYMTYSTTERVCPTKTYVPSPKPTLGTGKIGKRMGKGKFWVCLQGDTTPGDEEMYLVTQDTPPLVAVFTKRASPMQSSGAGTGNVQVVGVWELTE